MRRMDTGSGGLMMMSLEQGEEQGMFSELNRGCILAGVADTRRRFE